MVNIILKRRKDDSKIEMKGVFGMWIEAWEVMTTILCINRSPIALGR